MAAGGRHLAVVDGDNVAPGGPNDHETAATDVPRPSMDYRESKPDGHGGVHGVAAPSHDLGAHLAGQWVTGDDHAVGGADFLGAVEQRLRPRNVGERVGGCGTRRPGMQAAMNATVNAIHAP